MDQVSPFSVNRGVRTRTLRDVGRAGERPALPDLAFDVNSELATGTKPAATRIVKLHEPCQLVLGRNALEVATL